MLLFFRSSIKRRDQIIPKDTSRVKLIIDIIEARVTNATPVYFCGMVKLRRWRENYDDNRNIINQVNDLPSKCIIVLHCIRFTLLFNSESL